MAITDTAVNYPKHSRFVEACIAAIDSQRAALAHGDVITIAMAPGGRALSITTTIRL